jgi:outer membrane protein assembly factor BamB
MIDKSSIKTLSKYLAILSATIILIVSIFMIVNYLQLRFHNPITSNTVDNLVKKLNSSDNEQELREQIRVVDLLSRKAYFSSLWQLKTGAWILVGFGLLLIVSIKIYTQKELIESASVKKQEGFWIVKSKERKWLITGVGTIAMIAIVLSFFSNKYYDNFNSVKINETAVVNLKNSKEKHEVNTLQSGDSALKKVDSVQVADFPTDAEIKQNHPSFRGPFGLGINFKKNLPTSWDGVSGKNIVWKKSLSLPGLNSPVVWGNNLFIAGANEKSRKVFCYDRLTGKLKWTNEVKNVPGSPSTSPKVSNDAGYSASGLCTDGKRVYAIFTTGDLICFDNDGKQLWAKNLGVPDNHYGYSSSLQFYKDKLIIQYDDAKSCQLIALSTHTGTEIWKTKRDGQISWSSPIIVPKGNGAEIIVNNLPYVACFNAETGKEKWKTSCLSGEIGSSPAYGNGMVFAANEYAKMVAIKDGKVLWEKFDYLPDVSSPVAYKDYIFFTTSYGDMVCISQKDGAVLWHHEFDTGFYGSPVVADGKVYATDRSGKTSIVEANKEFKLVDQSTIGEKSDCTPAFADGMIYIRGYKNLYCIGKK